MAELNDVFARKVIDNRQITMVDAFQQIVPLTNHIDIAVGYFFLSGFETIEEEVSTFLARDGELRILMGNITNVKTGNAIHEGYLKQATTKELLFDELEKVDKGDEKLSLIKKLHQWIVDEKIQVKIYTGTANYFHAKSYLFYRQNPLQRYDGISIVGSSNFSKNGFIGNTELNSVSQDNFGALSNWFHDIWEGDEVVDFSMELLRFIDENVITETGDGDEVIYMSPQDSYLAFARYFVRNMPEEVEGSFMDTLYKHQRLGVSECKFRLERFNTCVLADGVGLGKTRTAAATIAASDFRHVLILASRKLHKQWKSELDAVGLKECLYTLVSKEEVARRETQDLEDLMDTDLIIVDEAHQGLKNSRTKLYRNLSFIKERGGRNVKGLLLTATPWNNSRSDVFNLGRLFLSVRNIHAEVPYFPYLYHSPRKAERAIENNDKAFKAFWKDMFLQRTKKTYGGNDVIYSERKFPVMQIQYEPQKEKAFAANGERIDRLHLSYMNPVRYMKGENEEEFTASRMKMLFLKRADSSWGAFKDTLENVLYKTTMTLAALTKINSREDKTNQFKQWLREYYALDIRDQYEGLFENVDEEEMSHILKLEELSLQRKEKLRIRMDARIQSITAKQAKYMLETMMKHSHNDAIILEEIINDLDKAFQRKDEKYEKVRDAVSVYLEKGEKVLLISQFRSTVLNYYSRFLQDDKVKGFNLAQLTGHSTDWYVNHDIQPSKEEILERFSPQSKKRQEVMGTEEEIQLVIGTETLSVGQNLQDCRVLMNLDLPYNPMNLEQRIGRIDRPREDEGEGVIEILTFPSMPVIEAELNLSQRLRSKLQGIYEDTKFDDLVLPEYQEFLNRVLKNRDVIEKDMEDMVAKTIQSTVLNMGAEEHSINYIESQKRMKTELDKEYPPPPPVELENCSFYKGSEHTAVVKVILKDVNGIFIDEFHKHLKIDATTSVEELTKVERQWFNSIEKGLVNNGQLSLETARRKLSEVKVFLEKTYLENEVDSYNKRIKVEEEIDGNMVDIRVKKVIVDIRESTRGRNKGLIASKIKASGAQPSSVKTLINHLRYVDRNYDAEEMEIVSELYENIDRLWENYQYYYDAIVKEKQNEIDDLSSSTSIRSASLEKSEVKWLVGNIGIDE